MEYYRTIENEYDRSNNLHLDMNQSKFRLVHIQKKIVYTNISTDY